MLTQRTLQRSLAGLVIGILVGVFMAWSYGRGADDLLGVVPLRNWELDTIDARFRVHPAKQRASKDIVVVTVDEDALSKAEDLYAAAWPWDRDVWGALLDMLVQADARAVAFDVTFPENRTRDQDVFIDAQAAYNRRFYRIAADYQSVVIGVARQKIAASRSEKQIENIVYKIYSGGAREDLESRLCPTGGADLSKIPRFPEDEGWKYVLRPPWPDLRSAAAAVGLTDRAEDIDDKERRAWLRTPVDGLLCPDFATATWAVAMRDSRDAPLVLPTYSRSHYQFGKIRIPLQPDGSAYIRWRGDGRDVYTIVRAGDILEAAYRWEEAQFMDAEAPPESFGSFQMDALAGKIVLVGDTYQGHGDVIGTPFGTQPGVFRHATILDMLLTGDTLLELPRGVGILTCLALPILISLLLTTLLPANDLSPRLLGLFGALALVLIYEGIAIGLFVQGRIADMSYTSWAMVSAGFWSILYAQFWAIRERNKLRDKLGVYTSAKVVNLMMQEYESGRDIGEVLAGQRVDITLFFSDIAGFTSISEELEPAELVRLLNEYLERMTDILVGTYDAVLDKYIGDAIMAFWGAPFPQPDQAERAVNAALDNLRAMDELAKQVAARGLPPMTARIGLNTGPAVCGDTGSANLKTNYTALGDTVNLAARLESINKFYGTRILMGPKTYQRSKHVVIAREVDWVKVKGKDIPESIYEVMCRRTDPSAPGMRTKATRYEEAFETYKSGRFREAEGLFVKLLSDYPADGPSELMLDRCRSFLKEGAPTDWTGAWEMTQK